VAARAHSTGYYTFPMPTRFLFVYGTLRSEGDRRMYHAFSRHADYVGKAMVPGRLYDLGPYPALVSVDEGEPAEYHVVGELYRLHPDRWADVLARLDAYEGVEAGLYRREQWTALRDDGLEVPAWVYVYARPLRDATLIPSGDYFAPDA
jgi:gamma-glutamylcyclotransferase (GGCT)/AIG2-like uncharacterized protein YtfP